MVSVLLAHANRDATGQLARAAVDADGNGKKC
jgi:hypothetical protein